MEVAVGNLQTEMLLDFFTEKIGLYYYNLGVADSLAVMTEKVDDLYLIMKDEI